MVTAQCNQSSAIPNKFVAGPMANDAASEPLVNEPRPPGADTMSKIVSVSKTPMDF
jgi:hypothetical protein